MSNENSPDTPTPVERLSFASLSTEQLRGSIDGTETELREMAAAINGVKRRRADMEKELVVREKEEHQEAVKLIKCPCPCCWGFFGDEAARDAGKDVADHLGGQLREIELAVLFEDQVWAKATSKVPLSVGNSKVPTYVLEHELLPDVRAIRGIALWSDFTWAERLDKETP